MHSKAAFIPAFQNPCRSAGNISHPDKWTELQTQASAGISRFTVALKVPYKSAMAIYMLIDHVSKEMGLSKNSNSKHPELWDVNFMARAQFVFIHMWPPPERKRDSHKVPW